MTDPCTVVATWEFPTVARFLDAAGIQYSTGRSIPSEWGGDIGGDHYVVRFGTPEAAAAFRRDHATVVAADEAFVLRRMAADDGLTIPEFPAGTPVTAYSTHGPETNRPGVLTSLVSRITG